MSDPMMGLDATYLSSISPRDARFDAHKANAVKVSGLYRQDGYEGLAGFLGIAGRHVLFASYAAKIDSCGNWLKFVKADDKYKLADARFCKVPTCPMCQWRRSLRWHSKFLSMLPALLEQYPTYRWVFLTLTVKNCEMSELRSIIQHMNQSFNRLTKLTGFPLVGYIKSVEVTRIWDCYHKGNYLGRHGTRWIVKWEKDNQDRLELRPTTEVHPHLHIAGMVLPSYFSHGYWSQATWTEKWGQSLRIDYIPVVNVKAVKATKKLPKPEDLTDDLAQDETGMIKAICEVCKYAVKEQDLVGEFCQDDNTNSDWLKLITEQLYNLRRTEYRGVLKGIGKELDKALENLVGESKEPEAIEMKEIMFRWESFLKRYVLISG